MQHQAAMAASSEIGLERRLDNNAGISADTAAASMATRRHELNETPQRGEEEALMQEAPSPGLVGHHADAGFSTSITFEALVRHLHMAIDGDMPTATQAPDEESTPTLSTATGSKACVGRPRFHGDLLVELRLAMGSSRRLFRKKLMSSF
jgi:hypothetical protein